MDAIWKPVGFFSHGWSYRPSGLRVSWKGSFERKLKVIFLFLSDPKNWRATKPPTPPLFFIENVLSTKTWNFVFCCQKTDHGCVFIYFNFFPKKFFVDTKNVSTGLILTESKSSSALFKWPKNWMAPRPLPCSFFPKITGSEFWDTHFVQHSWKTNNYVFGDDLIPTVSGGGAASLTIVYI